MKFCRLDKKIKIVWILHRAIVFSVIAKILVTGLIIVSNTVSGYQQYSRVVNGIVLAYLIYLFVGIFIYSAIEYRQWRYLITEDKVELHYGIFFVKTTVIPIAKVQQVTVTQGPIYRKLKLSKLSIYIANGQYEIDGINEKIATEISEYLKTKLVNPLNQVEERNSLIVEM